MYTRLLCPTTRQPFFFIPGPQAQSTQQRKICRCRRFFPPKKRAKKHRFPRLQTGAGCPLHTIDISECAFFALLIYQFAGPNPSLFSCCSSTMYATFLCSETECLQNYCKIRRSLYDASQFSMQNGEIYMLHSFSSQVYSFQRRRQFLRENKSNICMFFVWISAICVFLFACCFVIIIVYNGGMCRTPVPR